MNDPWKHRSAGMRCSTCMWFAGKQHEGKTEGDPWKIGRCRRHAPTMAGYPAVMPDDWCGDHRLDENKLAPEAAPQDPDTLVYRTKDRYLPTCAVCGALPWVMGNVCTRSDCPTRVTCGGGA